jgi:mRNA interferase MazF
MLTSGDVVNLDLGLPAGREAGFHHPVVVVTAQEILDESANVVQVVPLTSTLRSFGSEIRIASDPQNGLESDSAAQCQHIRSVSVDRIEAVRGNIGPAGLSEIREVLSLILDIS